MFAADDVKDIIIFAIGGLFTYGLAFIVNWFKAKHAAKLADQAEQDKHEIETAKVATDKEKSAADLALEFIKELRGSNQELRANIETLNNRVTTLEGELKTQREASRVKDSRIAELEREVADLKIRNEELERENQELRKRLDALEKGKAAITGRGK